MSRRGFTLIELSVVVIILAILFALAAASLSRARLAAHEASAIGDLRDVNNAQFAYVVECGRGNYATSLVVLGSPGTRGHSYLNADLGSNVTAVRSGYRINVQPGKDAEKSAPDCLGRDTQTQYYAVAVPEEAGKTGNRSFATNQSGTIWQRFGATPPPEPFGPPSTPAQ